GRQPLKTDFHVPRLAGERLLTIAFGKPDTLGDGGNIIRLVVRDHADDLVAQIADERGRYRFLCHGAEHTMICRHAECGMRALLAMCLSSSACVPSACDAHNAPVA